jgi:RimJ/RimL family protein N-acetyltransferase
MTPLDWPAIAPTLTDGSVSLRPWADGDADSVFTACQDPSIQRWIPIPVPYRAEHAVGFVGEFSRQQWTGRRGAPFAVVAPETDRLLGACALVAVDPANLVGEVGFWVAPWARGQKVAQRAARLLCDWALTEGGLARLELYVDPENSASCAVAERVGCEHEGVLRGKVVIHGVRRDMALYALVK